VVHFLTELGSNGQENFDVAGVRWAGVFDWIWSGIFGSIGCNIWMEMD
jgi:hypothetical protein